MIAVYLTFVILMIANLITKDKALSVIHIIFWNLILEKKNAYLTVATSKELKLLS